MLPRRTSPSSLGLLAFLTLGACLPLAASSVLPLTEQEETDRVAVVCVGEKIGAEYFQNVEGQFFTRTVFRVSESLKGSLPACLQVVTPGGELRGRGQSDGQSPRFETGQSYLLHLARRPDGSLTPLNGRASARRLDNSPPTSHRFGPQGGDMVRALRLRGKGRPLAGLDVTDQAASDALVARVTSSTSTGSITQESVAAGGGSGLLESNGRPRRFINAEQGQPIRVLVDMQTLPTGISVAQANTAVQNALNAWAAVARVTFLVEGTQNFGQAASLINSDDFRLRIQLHDSFNAIDNATTILGFGGGFFINTVSGLGGGIKGKDFDRLTCGYVILDHSKASFANNPKIFEEVLCHEVGHALGLDHSSENAAEPDTSLSGAIMYFRALNNGRGATLTAYDTGKIRGVYPMDNSPPYSPDRTIDVVTGANATGAGVLNGISGVNEVDVAGFDRESASGSLTATIVSQTAGNYFSLAGTKLRFSVTPAKNINVSAEAITDGSTYYDQAYVRLSDGVNLSPVIQVRTVSFSPDSKPTGNAPDGMPDAWATANLGASTALGSADADGDGLTNLQEFLQGTNPKNPNSRLLSSLSGTTSLQWTGRAFGAYRIERAASLVNPVWTTIGMLAPTAAPDCKFLLPAAAGGSEFYRVRTLP